MTLDMSVNCERVANVFNSMNSSQGKQMELSNTLPDVMRQVAWLWLHIVYSWPRSALQYVFVIDGIWKGFAGAVWSHRCCREAVTCSGCHCWSSRHCIPKRMHKQVEQFMTIVWKRNCHLLKHWPSRQVISACWPSD